MIQSYARVGAYVMGRRMFDEGEVNWPDPAPFRAPVFVLTNHAREPWVRQGWTSFTFVADGIESALKQAKAAAGDKVVRIAGDANVIQQGLSAGLLDELQIHLGPCCSVTGFGCSTTSAKNISNSKTRVVDSPRVTHLGYRVVKEG